MKDTLVRPQLTDQVSPSAAVAPSEFPGGIRVSDKVLAAFNHACAVGDLEAADELLVVMEKITERRIRRFGGDRRKESFAVLHAREHLTWQKAHRFG